jgi:hypothetical protein
MNERKQRYTAWGMMMGIMIGGGAATVMHATTGEAFYFGLIGVGLALGLAMGAAFEGRDDSS